MNTPRNFTQTLSRPGWNMACSTVNEVASVKLQIERRERENIVILDLKGQLTKGDEDLSLLKRLLLLLDSGCREVIVNLQEVSSIDASGLATLAFCATRFQDVGGRVVFLNPRRTDRPGADILEPDSGLEIYQEELDAVNSFFPDRVVPRFGILEFVQNRKERGAQLRVGSAAPNLPRNSDHQ
jgi:anti-sigma B factor antagonist